MTDRLIPSSGSEGRQSEDQDAGLLGCTVSGKSTDPPSTSLLRRVYEEISEVEHWLGGFGGQQAGTPNLRGLRAAVKAIEHKMDAQDVALAAAWQDIQDWVKTARGLRERSRHPKGPDFDNVPHLRGIEESERVLAQIGKASR